jgi:DNA-directed RNA polymerase subunit RPC12/RpoP
MSNQLGKRYRCAKCGTEVLCTKNGEGTVTCCDQEMELVQVKPLPSSD